jgi:hypothetical protein
VEINVRSRLPLSNWKPSSQQLARDGRRLLASLVAAGGVLLAGAEQAEALPLITLSGSARGLYGSAVSDPPLNPYGVGLGLRAGVTLPASIYVGAGLDYFFGESESLAGVDASASLLQVLAYLGYDAGFGPLLLRPSLGAGLAQTSVERLGEEESESDVVISPGAELVIGLGLLSVGAEARYNKVFADDADGLILGVGLGFSL